MRSEDVICCLKLAFIVAYLEIIFRYGLVREDRRPKAAVERKEAVHIYFF